MFRLLFVLFYVLIFSTESLSAQENFFLSGIITEKATGEHLIGANIIIPELQTGTVTNEVGFYKIRVPEGTYEIKFSLLGFKTVTDTITIDGDIKRNIILEESIEALDEVVITQDIERIDIRNPQMSSNSLNMSTIKDMPVVLGEVDVIKSILMLPGVTSAGEGASGFNVRGGAADQNLVLLDDATLYNSSHLFGFFSVFNPDALKHLTLYKGGIPARYGGRISSVLDITQREGSRSKYKATGGIGIISSRLTLEGPILREKASFLLGARSSYAHIFLPLFDNDNVAYFYDFNSRLDYDINEKNSMYFSGYFGRDIFDIADNFSNTFGNTSLHIGWDHFFSDKIDSELSLVYGNYDFKLTINSVGFHYISGIKNLNLQYDVAHYLLDDVQLNYGLSSIYYDFNPGEVIPSGENMEVNPQNLTDKFAFENAVYIEAEVKANQDISVKGGIRFSQFSRMGQAEMNLYENDNPILYNDELQIYEKADPIEKISIPRNKSIRNFWNIEPRFAISYQLGEENSIKASYNRMVQYIHLISNTSSPTPFDVYAPSGKYIEPQLGDQVALGYFHDFHKFSLETETFYKKVQNRIDYVDGADLIANNAIEQVILNGEARAYGLEILFKKNKGKLQGWIAYTLAKSEQRTPGRTPEEDGINNGIWYSTAWDKTHDFSITSTYNLNEKWNFAANFVFQTGQPVTFPNGQYVYQDMIIPTYAGRNMSRLPAYHRLDLSATLRPEKNKNRDWQGEWIFSIYNVYNRMNAASISFGQNEDTMRNEAVRLSIFGIIPAVTYNFKF